jgi:hypothetical protein
MSGKVSLWAPHTLLALCHLGVFVDQAAESEVIADHEPDTAERQFHHRRPIIARREDLLLATHRGNPLPDMTRQIRASQQ